MKYYFNFVLSPDDIVGGLDETFRIPTDPMYKQDGVYNQRCKFRITNFQLLGDWSQDGVQEELKELLGQTLVVRIANNPCMNSFTFKRSLAGTRKKIGQTPIEFHIRMDANLAEKIAGPDAAVVQTLAGHNITNGLTTIAAATTSLDSYKIFVPAGSGGASDTNQVASKSGGAMGSDAMPGSIASHTAAQAVSNVAATTITTPETFTPDAFLVSGFSYNSFDEELIGQPLWGDIPDIQFAIYSNQNGENTYPFTGDAGTLDNMDVAFTLEMEPIAVKL